MKRHAFTIIEIIFIVVILGILTAVAIPKMSANRVDAMAATLKHDIATLIQAEAAMHIGQNGDDPNHWEPNWAVTHITKSLWKVNDFTDPEFPLPLTYSTLAVDGGSNATMHNTCVGLGSNYDPEHGVILIVAVRDSPVCRKVWKPGRHEFVLTPKRVQF